MRVTLYLCIVKQKHTDMALQNSKMQQEKKQTLQLFRRQTWASLVRNTRTQHIWPTEIYPGFKKVNSWRKENHKWYATGEGARSFEVELVSAKDGQETIVIRFKDAMRFAEMGVGRGRPLEKVEHESNARYDQRYVSQWAPRQGKTHRPTIMMEARHLQERMKNYLRDFYGRYAEVQVYTTLRGIKHFDLGLG